MVDSLPETGLLEQIESKRKGEPTIAKRIIKNMSQTILDRAKCLMADKGYSGKPLQTLLEEAAIIPIIDNRHQWKEDETRQYLDTDLIGNQSGQVWYVADNGKAIELVYKGYDKSSDSLRYGFHPIGALAKMKVVITMSFLVMVGFALYKLNHGQTSQLASWGV